MEAYVYIKTWTRMFIIVQLKYPLIDEHIKNVVYSYNGILFNHKREGSTNICSNMDEPWKHYAWVKEASPQSPLIVGSLLFEMSRIGKSKETESRWVGA